MNVRVPRATPIILTRTLFSRGAWSCADGNGNLRGCGMSRTLIAQSKSPETLLQRAPEFIGRVKRFSIERDRDPDLVLDTQTVVHLLRETLLDFKSVTRNGE